MAPPIYEVARHGDGRWHVRRHGTPWLDSIHNEKVDAVTRARQLCRANQPSQLVIRQRDGTVAFVRTYGEGPVS
jgi:hypothetical protein